MTEPAHISIELLTDKCTVCMVCARECPDWCIQIEGHMAGPAADQWGRRRERQSAVLDRFDIDWSLCMFCGICVEVCPFDALVWSDSVLPADGDLLGLRHDKERLSAT